MADFEFVDRDYSKCSKETMPRQIKTRKKSFESIVSKYTEFKKSLYEKGYNDLIEKTLSSNYADSNVEQEIESNSLLIATLEKEIKILSKEDVPSRFIKSRAIKLRKSMMENLVRNYDGLYTIGLKKEDIVDESIVPNSDLSVSTGFVPTTDVTEKNNLYESNVETNSVEAVSERNNVSNDSVVDTSMPVNNYDSFDSSLSQDDENISIDSVQKVVDDVFNSFSNSNESSNASDGLTYEYSEKENNNEVSNPTANQSYDSVNSDIFDNIINEKFSMDSSNFDAVNDSDEQEVAYDNVDDATSSVEQDVADVNDNGVTSIVEQNVANDNVDDVTSSVEQDVADANVDDVSYAMEAGINSVLDDNLDSDNYIFQISENVSDDNGTKNDNADVDTEDNQEDVNDESLNRVSFSEALPVNDEKYDASGKIRVKGIYVPMTDDEIEDSRKRIFPMDDLGLSKINDKLSFDSMFIPSSNGLQVRDFPVVVNSDEDNEKENIVEDYSFEDEANLNVESPSEDLSDTNDNVTENDFYTLKDKVLKLREKLEEANRNKIKAQDSAQKIAQEAEDSAEKAERSKKILESKIADLMKYYESLESDCNEVVKETYDLEELIEKNSQVIQMNQAQFDDDSRIIGEIDNLISGDKPIKM